MPPLKNVKHEAFAAALSVGIAVDVAADMAALKLKPFDRGIADFYVYLLIDPADDVVFYIGKGKNRRCLRHLEEYLRGETGNPAKNAKLAEIVAKRAKPKIRIVQDGLQSKQAYLLEKAFIQAIGFDRLTNKMVADPPQTLLEQVTKLWRRLKPAGRWANEEPRSELDFKAYWCVYDGICNLKDILEEKERAAAQKCQA